MKACLAANSAWYARLMRTLCVLIRQLRILREETIRQHLPGPVRGLEPAVECHAADRAPAVCRLPLIPGSTAHAVMSLSTAHIWVNVASRPT